MWLLLACAVAPAPPSATLDKLLVEGHLRDDRSAVEAALRELAPSVAACAAEARGTLKLRIAVPVDGAVAEVIVRKDSTLTDPDVRACVQALHADLAFPPHPEREFVALVHPTWVLADPTP
ncbi:MAG: hypothetical protein EP330_19555 [Deltaproteobacteria bacterium]|nr:MAG: hypothetical protein EP330_19555 [Deltaproteobacteria bacterium]